MSDGLQMSVMILADERVQDDLLTKLLVIQ